MSRLAVDFLEQGLHRVMFDAMPMPVFVVDSDASILEYNAAAARLLGPKKKTVLRRRFGDVLHCLRAADAPAGCGTSGFCPDCEVRKSIQLATRRRRGVRRLATFERRFDHKREKLTLQVGCHPFNYRGHSFNLLIVEGLKA